MPSTIPKSLPRALAALFLTLALACDDGPTDPAGGSADAADAGADGRADAPAADAPAPDTPAPDLRLEVARLFPVLGNGASFPDCVYGSPLALGADDGDTAPGEVLVVATTDRVVGLDPIDGRERWSVTLPAPAGELPMVVATPALVGDLLVVGYHTTAPANPRDVNTRRLRQRVAVLDLAGTPRVSPDFAPVDLAAELPAAGGGTVAFDPAQHLMRAALAHARSPDDDLGRVYVTFGNARDLQPWHGWAFELDLDAWRDSGAAAAISGTLVTTPEADCGTPGHSGSRERVCGGGLWAPTGPLVVPRGEGGFELVLAPGNGQLDPGRGDYANTLMRTGPGLTFEPECDSQACADFDRDAPADACTESCRNLFVPRPFGTFPRAENGVCDGLPFFACWERLDFVGGSTPVYLPDEAGFDLLAYPTKDGSVYLLDADHFGTLFDREQLVAICGTEEDPCLWDWAGMIVTQPAVAETAGGRVLVVPTFVPDLTHEAGVFGLAIDHSAGAPDLYVRWQFPPAGSAEAVSRFRRHPTQPVVATVDAPDGTPVPIVWLAETAGAGGRGTLIGLRADTGQLLVDTPLDGPGQRFPRPLVHDGAVYLPTCESDFGRGAVEGYQILVDP